MTIDGAATTANRVEGNTIGANEDASGPLGNRYGVVISGGAFGNFIGGTDAQTGNLISGNDVDDGIGVMIRDTGTTGNVVEGNYIGTDPSGNDFIPNNVGVVIALGAFGNVIGGLEAGAGNVISGNASGDGSDGGGVEIVGIGTSGNLVQGNCIGTNPDGSASVANRVGISIGSGASANVIGGTAPEAGNLISGNSFSGIIISDAGTTGNLIEGNLIGTDKDGSGRRGNASGVEVNSGASANVIGGTEAGSGNVISGNPLFGVVLSDAGTTGNLVEGNFIGTNKDGASVLYNITGVLIESGASANVIGGTVPLAHNVISGNKLFGVLITGTGTTGNLVEGNLIGTNPDGSGPLSNVTGVLISAGATENVIGGTDAAAANVISGNASGDGSDGGGVEISGTGTTGNLVEGNSIGTNPDGSAAVGNRVGVSIGSGASANVIGGPAPRRATSSPATAPAASSSPTRARRLTWWKAT